MDQTLDYAEKDDKEACTNITVDFYTTDMPCFKNYPRVLTKTDPKTDQEENQLEGPLECGH